jgi:neopullulanase
MIKKIIMNKWLCMLVFLISLSIQAQIEKVEPPFWWSGMQQEDLQIMFYGKNIAEYDVVAGDNVIVKNIIRTENPNYVFLTINTKALPAGSYKIDFKRKGRTAFSREYELKGRRENSAIREGFDASDVMYLIMPDRFANGDPLMTHILQ